MKGDYISIFAPFSLNLFKIFISSNSRFIVYAFNKLLVNCFYTLTHINLYNLLFHLMFIMFI